MVYRTHLFQAYRQNENHVIKKGASLRSTLFCFIKSVFLCDFIAVNNARNGANKDYAEGDTHGKIPLKEDSGDDHECSADDKGNSAEQLTFFPGDIVFHAPACSKADDAVVAELWHKVTHYHKAYAEKDADKLVYVH